MTMIANLQAKIKQIETNIQIAQGRLDDVTNALELLEAVGMYPAEAREQWQTRPNSEGQYLYMLFRKNRHGEYEGPGGKRKVYVGADPEKIAEARRLNQNRLSHDKLSSKRWELQRWISNQEYELRRIFEQLDVTVQRSANIPEIPELTFIASKLPGLELEPT